MDLAKHIAHIDSHYVSVFLSSLCFLSFHTFPSIADQQSTTNISIPNDYEDYRQIPIQNAILLELITNADVIAVVDFDINKLLKEAPDTKRWAASIPSVTKDSANAYLKEIVGVISILKGNYPNSKTTLMEISVWSHFLREIDS